MTRNIVFSWSGGKDSALALYEILKAESYNIVSLITTVTEEYDRISVHGVRNDLLEKQTKSLKLPLHKINIPKNCSNDIYERNLTETLSIYKNKGITEVAFGDIFLEDVKEYRDELLKKMGMKGIYPIWQKDFKELAKVFIESGFRAITTCIDSQQIHKNFAGKEYDQDFLDDLPDTADPCGENGEFHTFVYNGPIFNVKVNFIIGDIVLRDNRFFYCDLIPDNNQ